MGHSVMLRRTTPPASYLRLAAADPKTQCSKRAAGFLAGLGPSCAPRRSNKRVAAVGRRASQASSSDLSRRAASAAAALGVGAAAWLRRRAATAKTTPGVEAPEVVEQSPIDPRFYKAETLSNGLRVLLVSDPEADRAAAALDVHVGYFSDPDYLPGLAHFCEHMLFLGTEQFPEESSFDKYLSANSGSSNAYTEDEDTCFFFSCGPSAMPGALERFASFFTAPLFTASATERELNAINSEHQKNLQSDSFRINQIYCGRCNPKHPSSHFGTGNRITLLERPKQLGLDIRAELLAYYRRFFCAPLMTLCIVGREDLATLSSYATRLFGGIGGGEPDPSAAWADTEPFLDDAFDSLTEVVPVADTRALEISFPVVFAKVGPEVGVNKISRADWRRYSPHVHVASVVGHEGPRSLCALLRRRGLATALNAGIGEENSSFALVNISLELTSEGFERRDEVTELIFGYLRLLRELPAWPQALIEENIILSEAKWRCLERQQPDGTAVALASQMQRYTSPKDYISGSVRLHDGPELQGLVATTAAALTPKNALITAVSRSFEAMAKETEQWYGTRFRREVVTSRQARWEAALPAPELALPAQNPFLPRSLELKAPRAKQLPRGMAPLPPSERRSDESWRAFFRQDTEYGTPKAYAIVELLTPYPRSTARCAILARLYEALVQDGLTESLLYDAASAGLGFNISSSARGVSLFFGGYDDRLVDFASVTLKAVREFQPAANSTRFEAQRDVLQRELESFATQQPITQVAYWVKLATITPDYPLEELRKVIASATPGDVAEYAEQLWKEPKFASSLCQGNLQEQEADKFVDVVQASLGSTPLPRASWPTPRITKLPLSVKGTGCALVVNAMDSAEKNSAVQVLYQTGLAKAANGEEGRRLWAAISVLSSLLRDGFYAELRTRQQLGYIVQSYSERKEGVVRLLFMVQGTEVPPVGMLDRIDAFLEQIRGELDRRSEADVRDVAASLAEARLARPQQLNESVERTFREVTSREFQWDRMVVEAEALRRVTLADVLGVFDRYVAVGGSGRRRLVTLLFGAAHRGDRRGAEKALKARGAQIVMDPLAFRAAQPCWGETMAA